MPFSMAANVGLRPDMPTVATRQTSASLSSTALSAASAPTNALAPNSPIRSKIDYKGEYGDFNDKPITLNGAPNKMTVTRQTGVTTNGQLAFLRTQGVEHFLKTQVVPLKHTQNTFQEFAVENKEKGGGYRRVSVEMTIHDVFTDVEPAKTEKQ